MQIEQVPIDRLRPHPRNYVGHPDDQLAHLVESLRANGFYRNIVVARDGTILAGHGIVQAARKMGYAEVPVRRLDVDPDSAAALKVLAGDNEVRHLVEVDDRALSELLRQIADEDESGLLGTGYDEMMLANLAMVTRPASEIADFDAAAAWVGLPAYQDAPDGQVGDKPLQVLVTVRGEEDRAALMSLLGSEKPRQTQGRVWSTWWPPKDKEDLASLKFKG